MTDKKKKSVVPILALDPTSLKALNKAEADLEKAEAGLPKPEPTVLEAILKSIKSQDSKVRMSFESDPQDVNAGYGSIFRLKSRLTPDHIIKRLIGPQGDDLLCAILQARSNMVASHGRPRTSRFAVGFEFQEINKGRKLSPEAREAERKRLDEIKDIIWNCGSPHVDDEYFHPNFSQFLKMISRDGLAYGRWATEYIWKKDAKTNKPKLHAWRPVDSGTIYRVIPKKEADQSARRTGLRLLAELKNTQIDPGRYAKDDYQYVQVIDGRPVQAFTDTEMSVHNLYPVTNVEYNGYPLTPIDQTLNAITTHINITLHNKLYFQNGRAARGAWVFQSDEVDESVLQKIRLQFHQSINNVSNAWRMPVFGVAQDDKLEWVPTDMAGRDAEFQYLSDSNARVILSSFQMSPEELPGYAHLARGTNTQALAESDNEWKLTAARDVGLRPLLYDVQDFLNAHILPKIDEEISKEYQLVLAGLDRDSPEKESTRLQQDMPIHMTMNEVLEHVEKRKIPKEMGGDMLFNPSYQQTIAPYLTVGQIMEYCFGFAHASQDPRYSYVRDPFWFQFQQLNLSKAQFAVQTQMMQQQQAQAQQQNAMGAENGGEPPPQEEQAPPGADETQKAEVAARNLKKNQEWLEKNGELLTKTIRDNHSAISKLILARHQDSVKHNLSQWTKEASTVTDKILSNIKGGRDEDK